MWQYVALPQIRRAFCGTTFNCNHEFPERVKIITDAIVPWRCVLPSQLAAEAACNSHWPEGEIINNTVFLNHGKTVFVLEKQESM